MATAGVQAKPTGAMVFGGGSGGAAVQQGQGRLTSGAAPAARRAEVAKFSAAGAKPAGTAKPAGGDRTTGGASVAKGAKVIEARVTPRGQASPSTQVPSDTYLWLMALIIVAGAIVDLAQPIKLPW